MRFNSSVRKIWRDDLNFRIERKIAEARKNIQDSKHNRDFPQSLLLAATRKLVRAEVLIKELETGTE